MRRFWITLLTIAATLATMPTAAAMADPPQPPGSPTTSWGAEISPSQKGKEHTDGTEKITAQQCWGTFANINREYNGTRYYLHFGGIQQCAPSAMSQDLQIFIYRWDPTDGWEFTDSAHAASPGANLISAYGEPYCLNTLSTMYYMKAWGTAGGVHLSPYPAVSATTTVNCDIG